MKHHHWKDDHGYRQGTETECCKTCYFDLPTKHSGKGLSRGKTLYYCTANDPGKMRVASCMVCNLWRVKDWEQSLREPRTNMEYAGKVLIEAITGSPVKIVEMK